MPEIVGSLWWAYLLLGLISGIFSATFGIGAGIVMVPALALIFNFPQKSAQGIALAVMVPMALVGAARYKLNPQIEINLLLAGILSVGGVLGAVIGSSIAAHASGLTLRRMFGLVLIIVAARMLLAKSDAEQRPPSKDQTARVNTMVGTTDWSEAGPPSA